MATIWTGSACMTIPTAIPAVLQVTEEPEELEVQAAAHQAALIQRDTRTRIQVPEQVQVQTATTILIAAAASAAAQFTTTATPTITAETAVVHNTEERVAEVSHHLHIPVAAVTRHLAHPAVAAAEDADRTSGPVSNFCLITN